MATKDTEPAADPEPETFSAEVQDHPGWAHLAARVTELEATVDRLVSFANGGSGSCVPRKDVPEPDYGDPEDVGEPA